MPLSGPEEVFLAAAATQGDRMLRVPDGETGERSNWIAWQSAIFHEGPYFLGAPPDAAAYRPHRTVRLRPGVRGEDVVFEPLGYAASALRSFAVFYRLREEGRLPAHYRFQVCLPTPLAPVTSFVQPDDAAAVLPAYGRRLMQEVAEITRSIPARLLALQWDVAIEFGILEGVFPGGAGGIFERIVTDLSGLGNAVPAEVELGYHLCYGDAGHRHFVEPEDTGLMVEVASAVAGRVQRPLNWIHLPVPRNRGDEAYLAPLRHRQLRPETELYLGLVHFSDGFEGTMRRLDAARRVVEDFGIATECGLGRRPPETIPALLRLHAQVSAAS